MAHGVGTIVDVRSQPFSKHAPEFTKPDLAQAAASAGLGYRWLGDRLGGRPHPGSAQLASGLREIDGLAASSTVALLCAEVDPLKCHRNATLAPALVAAGYEVMHILGDGGVTPYQEQLIPG